MINLTTNVRLKNGEILIRDPSKGRQLWPPKFLNEFFRDNPKADYLDAVKQ